MAKKKGKVYGLYVKASTPTLATDISEYTAVGLCKDLPLTRGRAEIDASDRDDSYDAAYEAGRRAEQIAGTFNFDTAGDTGQEILRAAYEADDADVWWMVSSNVSGDLYWYGQGICTQFDLSFPDEDMAALSTTIRVSGGSTTGTVA